MRLPFFCQRFRQNSGISSFHLLPSMPFEGNANLCQNGVPEMMLGRCPHAADLKLRNSLELFHRVRMNFLRKTCNLQLL